MGIFDSFTDLDEPKEERKPAPHTKNEDGSITVTVSRKLFHEDKSNFYILATDAGVIKGTMTQTFEGNIVGMKFNVQGEWESSPRGDTFAFTSIEASDDSIYVFLTKFMKGVGPSLAKKLINTFGEDGLINALENNPNEILKVKGIREKKRDKIVNSWNNHKRD